jgi:ABC-2 type transport system permease protein
MTSTSGISIGYVNNDRGTIGADLITYLAKTDKNKLIPLKPDTLEKNILDGMVNFCFVIPVDFSSKLLDGDNPGIHVMSLQGEQTLAFITHHLNFFIHAVIKLQKAAKADESLFSTLYDSFIHTPFRMTTREVNDRETSKRSGTISFGFFIFLILMQATIITGLILKDKENRTYYRIRISPVREIYYSLGNMLAAFIIISCQIFVTLFIMEYIVRIDPGFFLFSTLPVLLAFSISSICFGLMITAISGSTMQAVLLTNFIVIPTSMIGGCFWPLELMPETIRYIAGIFPQTWAIRAIEELQNRGTAGSPGFSILLLLASGGLFLTIYIYNIKYTKNVKRII